MHISEGLLEPQILIGGAVITLGITAYAVKKLKNEEIPLVSVFSALFFLGSFIHVPVGPVSVHLILNGIIGGILGLRAFIAIFIALLIQGLIFGYGGVSTLGINTFNLAFPALLSWYMLSFNIKNTLFRKIQYFFIGSVSVLLSAILLSLTLALNGDSFVDAAKIALVAHIPIMLIEGIITMFALLFLDRVYPQLLRSCR